MTKLEAQLEEAVKSAIENFDFKHAVENRITSEIQMILDEIVEEYLKDKVLDLRKELGLAPPEQNFLYTLLSHGYKGVIWLVAGKDLSEAFDILVEDDKFDNHRNYIFSVGDPLPTSPSLKKGIVKTIKV